MSFHYLNLNPFKNFPLNYETNVIDFIRIRSLFHLFHELEIFHYYASKYQFYCHDSTTCFPVLYCPFFLLPYFYFILNIYVLFFQDTFSIKIESNLELNIQCYQIISSIPIQCLFLYKSIISIYSNNFELNYD